jgi:hypothetical protein
MASRIPPLSARTVIGEKNDASYFTDIPKILVCIEPDQEA